MSFKEYECLSTPAVFILCIHLANLLFHESASFDPKNKMIKKGIAQITIQNWCFL